MNSEITYSLNDSQNRRGGAVSVLGVIELHDGVGVDVHFGPLLRRLVRRLLELDVCYPASGLSTDWLANVGIQLMVMARWSI